jgi:hypothetical protein
MAKIDRLSVPISLAKQGATVCFRKRRRVPVFFSGKSGLAMFVSQCERFFKFTNFDEITEIQLNLQNENIIIG